MVATQYIELRHIKNMNEMMQMKIWDIKNNENEILI